MGTPKKMQRKNYLLALPDRVKVGMLFSNDTGQKINFSSYPYAPSKIHFNELRAHVMNNPELKQLYIHLKESNKNANN